MNIGLRTTILLAGICLLVGCAQTGVPLPPSLELPRPPSDLRAERKANQVTLTWQEPTLTTDHQGIRYLGPTQVCRLTDAKATACGVPVHIIAAPANVPQKPAKKSQTKQAPPVTYTDSLPESLLSDDPDAEVTYAVEVLNRNARSAGLSNRIEVPAIRTLPAPTDVSAGLNDDGVLLKWTSSGAPPSKPNLQYRYRIYRREEGAAKKEAVAGEVPVDGAGAKHFLDSIEWEKTYLYRITAVSIIAKATGEVQVEGDDSPSLRVVAHDVFPPSVPAGLQAVYSGEGQKPFIDLIWAPVAAADLAGYNVFRSESGGAFVKINSDVVKTPSYRDAAIASGKTYTYAVSSIDIRGNESARSEIATESVP
jgi:hypothetical protein